jgi:putative GTP pyrophosphokinase
MATLSKTQIDRLGDRLEKGPPTDDDLRLLDEYRLSFGPTYDFVIRTIREKLQLNPTGRPAKSTSSIVEKLRRESIRLSQVQDIAGCRVVISDVLAQDQTIATLNETFSNTKIIDRRINPSYGYRAVHVIVTHDESSVEIQIRTSLQHLWAELSERLADVVDLSIKYGGGEPRFKDGLLQCSTLIAGLEILEKTFSSPSDGIIPVHSSEIQELQEQITRIKNELADGLLGFTSRLKGKDR